MDPDLTLELKRDVFGRWFLKNPGASRNELVDALLGLANDKRQSSPGRGLVIHDDTERDYPLDQYLELVQAEIEAGVIHK
jgi:hypothetical protein